MSWRVGLNLEQKISSILDRHIDWSTLRRDWTLTALDAGYDKTVQPRFRASRLARCVGEFLAFSLITQPREDIQTLRVDRVGIMC